MVLGVACGGAILANTGGVRAECTPTLTQLYRAGSDEAAQVALKRCDGEPNVDALTEISILARPKGVPQPSAQEVADYPRSRGANPNHVAPGIVRIHQGFLRRLHYMTQHFPGKAIEIVSGHRPNTRETSRHFSGRALDLRVRGVAHEKLVEVLRKHPKTGVGYYPNSVFVHLDVRPESGFWVDRSGRGERPDYGAWPPKAKEAAQAKARVLSTIEGKLASLDRIKPLDSF